MMMAHTQTILKCKVTNNQSLMTVIEKLPSIPDEIAYVGMTFSATKVHEPIGTTVYLNLRLHPSRSHMISFQTEGKRGHLQDIFEEQLLAEKEALGLLEPKKTEQDPTEVLNSILGIDTETDKGKEQHFYVSEENAEIFGIAAIKLKSKPNQAVKLLIVGDSGYGKTSMAQRFAKKNNMNCVRMNCATVRDPEEWFGYRMAEAGTISFMKSNFINKVEEGNCVVILDEFNRLEPWLTNSIFPLLDHDQKSNVFNQEFVVGPNVLWVATVNVGFQFAGTFQLDEAITNRFDMIARVGSIPSSEEEKVLVSATDVSESEARLIVSLANKIRNKSLEVPVSIRTTIQIAELVAAGASIRSALQHTIVMRTSINNNEKSQKILIDLINTEIGVYKNSGLLFDFS